MNQSVMYRLFHYGILCCLICLSSIKTTVRADDNSGWAIAATVLGALATIGGVCYLCHENDEQLLERSNKALKTGRLFVTDVDNFCATHYITSSDVNPSHIGYNEDTSLAPFGHSLIALGRSGRSYLSDVYAAIRGLQDSKKSLSSRIRAMEDMKPYERDASLLRRMNLLYAEIIDFLPYLELYYNFRHAHRHYFDLGEHVNKIAVQYRQENLAFSQYLNDPVRLAYAIRQAVGSHTDLHGRFRLVAYKTMIDRDLYDLRRHIDALRFSYPTMYTAAIRWEDFLKHIRGVVLADPDYREQEWELYSQPVTTTTVIYTSP